MDSSASPMYPTRVGHLDPNRGFTFSRAPKLYWQLAICRRELLSKIIFWNSPWLPTRFHTVSKTFHTSPPVMSRSLYSRLKGIFLPLHAKVKIWDSELYTYIKKNSLIWYYMKNLYWEKEIYGWVSLKVHNADLKICFYVLIYIKIMPWKFCIFIPRIGELFTRITYIHFKK